MKSHPDPGPRPSTSSGRPEPVEGQTRDLGCEELEPERYELFEPSRYKFELDRREFVRVLGGGLAVFTALPPVLAQQESGRGGGQPRAETAEVGAWLHIDERGNVTAYTGKVEIGQNIRTSLAQAVADELRVPMDSITFVMADTDLTPFDQGTFGSQSTPRMSRQLARAAATAREILIDRAAARWQVDRSTLTARDGKVFAVDSLGRRTGGVNGPALTYAELASGAKLTGAIAAQPAITPADRWEVRGKAPKKVNGRAFVTGAHQFTPDIVRPGMLYGRVLRPPAIGATLVTMDDGPARGMSGVTIVRDGDFTGVVAVNERLAGRALDAIKAQWREAPGQPSSDSIYAHLKTGDPAAETRATVAALSGDGARAKAAAARTITESYRIPYIAHVPLEPRAAVAEWVEGKLTVWTGTQRPFGVRTELMTAFRLREDQVRVIVPDMGSAYGGKHSGEAAIEAARLAKGAGRPVKLVWTRAEEFMWAYFRPAGVIDVTAAVDAAGQLIVWEFDNWNSGNAGIASPYQAPHQRIAFHRSPSALRQGSYRGLAATANHYAREIHIDRVARELKADPVEFRLRHLKDERMRAVLTAAAEKIGWPRPSAAGRALGIACGTEKGSYVATAAELSRAAEPPGFKIVRLVVTFECGAIVNPDGLHNQVEGSVVQGLGGALFEAVEFRDGRITNGSMARYRVPRFRDVPSIEIVLLDRKDLPSAGAGETPIVCVAPAIGSAARAFGAVAPALPVTLL